MINDTLHPHGFLGWVQSTGKQPADGQPLPYDKVSNFEDFGCDAFLLAGSEVYKLAPECCIYSSGQIKNGKKQKWS